MCFSIFIQNTFLNSMVKDASASYFAILISSSKPNPKVLFDTINTIVTPAPPECLSFQIRIRIEMSGLASIPSSNPFSADRTWPSILDCFSPIALQDLIDLGGSMKPSLSPVDI